MVISSGLLFQVLGASVFSTVLKVIEILFSSLPTTPHQPPPQPHLKASLAAF